MPTGRKSLRKELEMSKRSSQHMAEAEMAMKEKRMKDKKMGLM